MTLNHGKTWARELLTPAFPANLASPVASVALLGSPSDSRASERFAVFCDAETLQIPVRIYGPVLSDATFAALSPLEQAIAACWFTRHHDGYVRERFLRTLTAFDSPWVIAYVVALSGEYVVEIISYIWENRSLFDRVALGGWLRENPAFFSRTRSRVVSYWDCYHRSSSPDFGTYIGARLIAFFENARLMQHESTSLDETEC